MRSPGFLLAALFIVACGTTSSGGGSGAPATDAGSGSGTGAVDAGTGAGGGSPGVDAGTGGGGAVDAGAGGGTGSGGGGTGSGGGGTGSGGGSADAGPGSADAGTGGGGTAGSDCDGLAPQTPGAPSQFKLVNQDLNNGSCFPGETDGTGHIAVSWQNFFQPHNSDYTFVDPATSAKVGAFTGAQLFLIGQASGFMGGECAGADCEQRFDVLGPTGQRVNGSSFDGPGNGVQANDPTGGMIHARLASRSTPHTVLLDAIDAAGNVRWTRSLPETFPSTVEIRQVLVGVDRQGNVLALWKTSTGRFGASAWAAQWFDHDGNRGPEFQALPGRTSPTAFFERVGSGLFLAGEAPSGSSREWLGQFEPLATSISDVPAWLAARPNTRLHMVHGGAGYAVMSFPGASDACEQSIEVVSPSGQSCGTSSFSIGGGACTPSSIVVGYDGTVVQQLPREREAPCTAAGHQCDCTYRFWPGFFR